MRFQGRITDWKDERGFGFITPNGGGAKVFLHFKSIQNGEHRPSGGELVTYEVVPVPGKGPRAENVQYVDRSRTSPAPYESDGPGSVWGKLSTLITVVLLIAMAAYAWQKFNVSRGRFRSAPQAEERAALPPAPRPQSFSERVTPDSTSSAFKCEGKRYCSQMTSCEEAKFYLKNCPDVRIDGDGDGIPCESQWCK
jgi:cold shock CspA family protein